MTSRLVVLGSCGATDLGQRPESLSAEPGPVLNLTAREAGEAAAAARARRLLLTHFWPGNDRRAELAAASAAFPDGSCSPTRAST